MKTFNVGDRVRIIPGTRFADQSKSNGTITKVNVGGWHSVTFDDGYSDGYRDFDLEPAEIDWKEMVGD